MDRLRYVPATLEHLLHVARHMRRVDVEEILAGSSRSPLEALLESQRVSEQTVAVLDADGRPVAVFGVAPSCRLTGKGTPWMLGTDELSRYWRELTVDARRILGIMLDIYPRLENWVHIKNVTSVRWLQFLGFVMDPPVTLLNGEQFMRFHLKKDSDHV